MDFKTYKIEEYKDGNWVNATSSNPNGSFTDEYTGLTEDQTQHVIDYLGTTGIGTSSLRVTEES